IGDAACAPFEGVPADWIWHEFGGALRIIANPPIKTLAYTDDTQMCIGVAETLIEEGEINEPVLCGHFAANYQPARCYGPGARRILEAMIEGKDWRSLTLNQFPGGSLG